MSVLHSIVLLSMEASTRRKLLYYYWAITWRLCWLWWLTQRHHHYYGRHWSRVASLPLITAWLAPRLPVETVSTPIAATLISYVHCLSVFPSFAPQWWQLAIHRFQTKRTLISSLIQDCRLESSLKAIITSTHSCVSHSRLP